ncbi:NUDIX domain-containing protein [Paenibacillus amylolyticus]|uniref:NUDIX domain-containing protein n=1 Tax=Paenibacillus amylolyticus TaxID=1451 RepID=UPI000B86C9BA|nr:NUDIX domain-containing protein [Paenibacillus amylolyticus]
MTSRIVVTGGAIIRDHMGRVLLQKRSDYGDWGLPGGGMEPGERIEETMIREVKEETGLDVSSYKLASIYTGERMHYTYPDGNEVVFVMFLFDVIEDEQKESLQLIFKSVDEIDIATINNVQKPIFVDLKQGESKLLRE